MPEETGQTEYGSQPKHGSLPPTAVLDRFTADRVRHGDRSGQASRGNGTAGGLSYANAEALRGAPSWSGTIAGRVPPHRRSRGADPRRGRSPPRGPARRIGATS